MGGGGPAGAAGGGQERRKSAAGTRQRQAGADTRQRAISEIQARSKSDPLRGTGLAAVGDFTRSRMVRELQRGGTPVTTLVGGREMTVGVIGRGLFGDTAYTGRAGFDPIARRAEGGAEAVVDPETGTVRMPQPTTPRTRLPSQQPDDSAPLVTAEVTPEVVPDESAVSGRGERSQGFMDRRRTRNVRRGGGGTLVGGYGILERS